MIPPIPKVSLPTQSAQRTRACKPSGSDRISRRHSSLKPISVGLFDYWIRIRIHNESESEVNPTHTRHAHWSKVIRFAKWISTEIHCESGSGFDNRIAPVIPTPRSATSRSSQFFSQPLTAPLLLTRFLARSAPVPLQCSKQLSETRRPTSADRTARRQFLAGLRGDVELLIDGYLESPFPTACLLQLKCSYLANQCMAMC